ncbi:MAG: paraquat-inducible protein A [Xanthomonadales bacterium]|nr:paraquat-inducible protein A [Xanthomonadales bacterium]
MPVGPRALRRLLVAAALAWAAGILLPVVRIRSFWVFNQDQSILGAAWHLLGSADWWLGLTIALFSLVLPPLKMVLLYRRVGRPQVGRSMLISAGLAKWNMLDVLIVAATVGCVQLGILGATQPGPGVYWFFLAVVLSMGVAVMAEPDRELDKHPGQLVAILHAVALGLGLGLPLMEVNKWVWWDQRFSVIEAMAQMSHMGHWQLPLIVLVFVALIPACLAVADLRPAWDRGGWTSALRHWSMLEVFVAAWAAVAVKLVADARISLEPGAWFLLGAALLGLPALRRSKH